MPNAVLETPYNITGLVNSSSLGNLMTNIAPVLGDYTLGNAFLLIIFLVTFIYLKGMNRFLNRSCVMGAMSLTMISSLFLFSMGVVGTFTLWFIVFLWITILGFIVLVLEE